MEGGANVATITFSWACRTHVYKNQLDDNLWQLAIAFYVAVICQVAESGGSCIQERAAT